MLVLLDRSQNENLVKTKMRSYKPQNRLWYQNIRLPPYGIMMDKCVHRLHTGSDPIITDSFSGGVSSFVTQLQTTAQYSQGTSDKHTAPCLVHSITKATSIISFTCILKTIRLIIICNFFSQSIYWAPEQGWCALCFQGLLVIYRSVFKNSQIAGKWGPICVKNDLPPLCSPQLTKNSLH